MAGLFYLFDSPFSFREEEYVFQYQGVLFKLMNGGQKYQHSLCTVLVQGQNPDELDRIALEFLGCLAFSSDMPVIYQGCLGIDAFNVELFKSSVRNIRIPRKVPLDVVNHDFPRKLLDLSNRNKRCLIAIFQEALLSRSSLPHYAFLSYWKILSIIIVKDGEEVGREIIRLIGQDFFKKQGYVTEASASKYLKEDLRNRIGHMLGKGRKDIFIMDSKVYLEVKELNRKLHRLVAREIRGFCGDYVSLNLIEAGS